MSVGTNVEVKNWGPDKAPLKVQVTVIGGVPVAALLRQPGIRFPAIVKLTFPATGTTALKVSEEPFETVAGTVRLTAITTPELLVMVRDVIAAISLPATSIQRPRASPEIGEYAKVTDAPETIALAKESVAVFPEKAVAVTAIEEDPSLIAYHP